jgi:hypothetical protein
MWYRREGATVTAITEATLATTDAAHSDGGIIHLSDGYYRLDLPDAAVATGVASVMVGGAVTGMIVIGTELQLVNYNPQDAVRLGLTALPNAAADAAGGLAISDAGGLDLDAKLANTNEVTAARMGALTDWINGGRLDAILDIIAADTTTDIPGLLATIDGIVDDILVDTAVIGALGAGLTALASATNLADLHTDVGTAITNIGDVHATDLPAVMSMLTDIHGTDLPAVKADTADIHTDVGTAITAIGDIHATDLPDLHTDVGTALTNIADLHTDVGTAIADIAATHVHAAGGESDIAAVHLHVADILADTNELQVDDYPTSIAAVKGDTAAILTDTAVIGALGAGLTAIPWNAAWDAEVQSEVVDALNVDTYAEPGQETPAATNTLVKKIGYIFKFLRNKLTATATQISVYNDDGTTVGQKSTISDDATTFTRGEFGTGA